MPRAGCEQLVDVESVTQRFASLGAAPANARRFLTGHRAVWMDDSTWDDALLLLTEIVTNALRHGGVGDTFDLIIRNTEEGMWVGVAQPSPFSQPAEIVTERRAGGSGLMILDRLSSRWGSDEEPGRTVVWFELDRTGDSV